MPNEANKGLYYNFILEPYKNYAGGSAALASQIHASQGVRNAINDLARFNPKLGAILQKAGYNKIQFADLLPLVGGEAAAGETDECADTKPGHQNEPDFRIGGRTKPNGSYINSRFATLHEFGHALNDLMGSIFGKDNYTDTVEFKNAYDADVRDLQDQEDRGLLSSDQRDYFHSMTANGAASAELTEELLPNTIAAIIETLPSNGQGNQPLTVHTSLNSFEVLALFPKVTAKVRAALDAIGTHKPDEFKDKKQCDEGDGPKHFKNPKKPGQIAGQISGAAGAPAYDPIILDLNGDGVQTVSIDAGFTFDNHATGFANETAWVSDTDGFLAIDSRGDGYIVDGSQFFGTSMKLANGAYATSGFEALSQFDSNHDGLISSLDSVYSQIGVLKGEGTFETLSELGIESISLASTAAILTDSNENTQLAVGSFTWANGQTGFLADYALKDNTMLSSSTVPVEVSAAIQALPTARGLGTVRDLQQAMELDTSGALVDLVTAFSQATSIEQQDSLLTQILLKWTDSDTLPHDLPGLHMDNQVYNAVQRFYGQTLTYPGALTGAPGIFQSEYLSSAFQLIKEYVYAQMVSTGSISDLADLLAQGEYNNPADVPSRYDLTLVSTALLDLEQSDPALASFKATQFVKMLDGFAIAEDTDFALTFRDIIAASSPALLAVIDQYSTGVTSFADNATIVRSSIAFNETINAHGNNDFIYMGDGALSVLNSTGENTFVVGGRFGKNIINLAGGNNRVYLRSPGTSIEQIDVLGADADVHFGPGTTLIVEGQGNGKFFFDQGDGALTVRGGAVDLSQSHKDRIVFGAGILPGDIQMSLEGTELTNVRLTFNGSADNILLENEIVSSLSTKHVSEFEFADGSVLNLAQIQNNPVYVTFNGDFQTFQRIYSPLAETTTVNGSFNTVLVGTGNSNFIDNGSGNHFFLSASASNSGNTGIHTVTVGQNARITEGGGRDTFNIGIGSGTTVIQPFGSPRQTGDFDTINFGSGISASSLYFWAPPVSSGQVSSYDLNIDLASGDKIILSGTLAARVGTPNTLTPKYVENFTFADGSTLSLNQVLEQGVHVIAFVDPFFGGPTIDRRFATWKEITTIVGNNGFVYDGSGGDQIEDRGVNNYINAGAGANTIIVGTNTTIQSEAGSDEIITRAGFGTLTVNVAGALGGTQNNGRDTLQFYDGVTLENISVVWDGSYSMSITLANGDHINVTGQSSDESGLRNIGSFRFADGSSYTAQQLVDSIVTVITNDQDNVLLDRSASTGRETINNSGNFDQILMGSGNTTVNDTGTQNTITAGTGTGVINAGDGDTIIASSGTLTITAANGTTIYGGAGDTSITIGAGVSGVSLFEQVAGTSGTGFDSVTFDEIGSIDALTLTSSGKDLTLVDAFGTAVLTLKDALDASAIAKTVGQFSFADASQATFADLLQRDVFVADTSVGAIVDRSFSQAREFITHTGTDSTFLLGAGDVNFTAGVNDTVHAGKGSGVFNVGAGAGTLTIVEDAAEVNPNAGDLVQFTNQVDESQVLVRASGSDFSLTSSGGETVTVVNQLGGAALKNVGAFFNADGSILVDAAEIQQIADASRGTSGDDVLTGSRFGDIIAAGDGNDSVAAGLGNDDLSGGIGDDFLYGEDGNDFLYGDDGDDTASGGIGNDSLSGGLGADSLDGGDGNDGLAGGQGNDFVSGGTGDDIYRFNLGDGLDVFNDGAGVLGGGNDTIELGVLGSEVTYVAEGLDLRINFNLSADSILVQGFLSNDTSQHIELVRFSDGATLTYADIVNQLGGGQGQTITGTNGANNLVGTNGADTISALGGADTVSAGGGNDLVYGGDGADSINGEAGDDHLFGEAGIDTIHGGLGADAIEGGNGNDFLYGDEGNDNVLGGAGADYIDGGIGDDNLDGSTGADIIYGRDGNDILTGGSGNDSLDGGDGADNIDGGAGADTIYGMAGADTLSGGGGDDLVDGGDDNDTISGGNGIDTLFGGLGDDHIDGGAGSDEIYGGAGNDILIGAGGHDTIYGDDGNDSIYGESGNDNLSGGTGNDYIEGRAGTDVITGGQGDDSLTGGTGNDTYLFNRGDGNDTVADNGRAADQMDIIRFGAGITTNDVAFYMEGNNLYLSQGAGDTIQVTDQTTNTARIERFELEDGSFVSSADVNLIIQQIAAYQQDTGASITNVNDVRNNQDLMTIVANNWHAA